jgi:hypothetical protein
MSKKSKRQTRRTGGTATQSTSVAAGSSGSMTLEREFKPDYSQTIKDLRRIGTLAGTFFAILVILSFFLR